MLECRAAGSSTVGDGACGWDAFVAWISCDYKCFAMAPTPTKTHIGAIFIPTMDTIYHMKRVPDIVTMDDAAEYVREALVRYETLLTTQTSIAQLSIS